MVGGCNIKPLGKPVVWPFLPGKVKITQAGKAAQWKHQWDAQDSHGKPGKPKTLVVCGA